MAFYPLLFRFRDLIAGKGFLAGVEIQGRALLEVDGSDHWIYGVNPGCYSVNAESQKDALDEFRKGWLAILTMAAGEAGTFSEFKGVVDRFFHNASDEDRWAEAVAAVQAGLELPGLPRVSADAPRSVEVHDLTDAIVPAANPDPNEDEIQLAACA